jgi:SAM-dependent methyltransferase
MLRSSSYIFSTLVAGLSDAGRLGLTVPAFAELEDLPEDAVSLLQVQQAPLLESLRRPDYSVRDGGPKYLAKYAGPLARGIGTTATAKEHFLAGVVDALNIDDNAGSVYNWGIASGMRWDDWWDGLMKTYPPAKDGYELMNFGMVSEPFHKCAADVPSGTPGRTLPFNHTNAANMYSNLVEYSPKRLYKAEVLEISSGRGGGSALVSDCFCPARMVGLDIGHEHILYAQNRYARVGKCPIEFVEGDAMNLPFKNETFDVIINVQASHAYPSFRKLANEAHRVLRPGGAFLFADFRYIPGLDTDAMILHNVFQSPLRSVDVGDKVAASFDQNRLINPFVSTCHVDFGLHGFSAVSRKAMKMLEPLAPIAPLVKKFMKKGPLGTVGYPMPLGKASLLQNGTGYAGMPEGYGKPKTYYKDLYNTPKEPAPSPQEMKNKHMAQVRAKVKNFFHDLVMYNSSKSSQGEEMEAARSTPLSMARVKGVPTPLSCVNQAGIAVEDGLHRKSLEYRFYIVSKPM